VDCAEPMALAEFWATVLGGEARMRDAAWCYVDPPGWTRLAFQKVPEGKSTKNRLHLDIEVDDVTSATTAAVGLGAVVVGPQHHSPAGSFQVLLDPEGNEWCVVRAAESSSPDEADSRP